MEQKNSNATLIIIALTVIVIVAMVCGMVMWIMTRTMAMNERLLEVRLAETKQQQAVAVQPVAVQPVVVPTPQPAVKPEPAKQPVKKAEVKPATKKPEPKKVTPKPQPKKPEVKPEPKKTAPARLVPQETPEGRAKVGPDGLPLDRITLPVGNDDLDWQF